MLHARDHGRVFDRIAPEYDRHRPAYPGELVDHACATAGLGAGDAVLEVGCGTGQLTRALVDRGLEVTALDPGERLIELAERNLGPDRLRFVRARFEDAALPQTHFPAVFSASAWHWIDPDVSWAKAAGTLRPGGTLALIQYCGLIEEDTKAAHEAFAAALANVSPDLAAAWPPARDLASIAEGVAERRANVSDLWGWLGGYDLRRAAASELFGDEKVAYAPVVMEHTAAELNSTLRTMSMHHRLAPDEQAALDREVTAVAARFGPLVRSSAVAVAVTARRTSPGGSFFRGKHRITREVEVLPRVAELAPPEPMRRGVPVVSRASVTGFASR